MGSSHGDSLNRQGAARGLVSHNEQVGRGQRESRVQHTHAPSCAHASSHASWSWSVALRSQRLLRCSESVTVSSKLLFSLNAACIALRSVLALKVRKQSMVVRLIVPSRFLVEHIWITCEVTALCCVPVLVDPMALTTRHW